MFAFLKHNSKIFKLQISVQTDAAPDEEPPLARQLPPPQLRHALRRWQFSQQGLAVGEDVHREADEDKRQAAHREGGQAHTHLAQEEGGGREEGSVEEGGGEAGRCWEEAAASWQKATSQKGIVAEILFCKYVRGKILVIKMSNFAIDIKVVEEKFC